jgi:IS4 transposase
MGARERYKKDARMKMRRRIVGQSLGLWRVPRVDDIVVANHLETLCRPARRIITLFPGIFVTGRQIGAAKPA